MIFYNNTLTFTPQLPSGIPLHLKYPPPRHPTHTFAKPSLTPTSRLPCSYLQSNDTCPWHPRGLLSMARSWLLSPGWSNTPRRPTGQFASPSHVYIWHLVSISTISCLYLTSRVYIWRLASIFAILCLYLPYIVYICHLYKLTNLLNLLHIIIYIIFILLVAYHFILILKL